MAAGPPGHHCHIPCTINSSIYPPTKPLNDGVCVSCVPQTGVQVTPEPGQSSHSVFNPFPKAVAGEAEQPSPNTWDRRAGGTRGRTRCSLCLHTPHLFPCLLQGLHRELLVGSDSQLSCSLGSSPGAGEKRARGEGQTQGPHGGGQQLFPTEEPCGCQQNPNLWRTRLE